MPLEKDEHEHPIPSEWRATFCEIAEAFAAGDYSLARHAVRNVEKPDPETARSIADNILSYGDKITTLSSSTWHRSVYIWAGHYWEMLVDLSTEREEVSDLTLHAMVYDTEPQMLKIHLVYVP